MELGYELRTFALHPHWPPFPWRVLAPSRVVFFVLTATLGKILTLNNLRKRHVLVVDWCCMCKRSEETKKCSFLKSQLISWGLWLALKVYMWMMRKFVLLGNDQPQSKLLRYAVFKHLPRSIVNLFVILVVLLPLADCLKREKFQLSEKASKSFAVILTINYGTSFSFL